MYTYRYVYISYRLYTYRLYNIHIDYINISTSSFEIMIVLVLQLCPYFTKLLNYFRLLGFSYTFYNQACQFLSEYIHCHFYLDCNELINNFRGN